MKLRAFAEGGQVVAGIGLVNSADDEVLSASRGEREEKDTLSDFWWQARKRWLGGHKGGRVLLRHRHRCHRCR